MKDPDYVMNMMASWTARDELEDTKIRIDFTDNSGTNQKNIFTYQHQFGINYKYKHKIDYNNNWRRAPTFLDRTLETKYWKDCNFS